MTPITRRWRHSKVWLGLFVVSVLLTWGGYRLGDRYGLLIGFFTALGLNALVFFFDEWRIARDYTGLDYEGRDPYGILRNTRMLARELELPTPLVREIASDTPYIFSAGLFPRTLKIFISSALVRRFTEEEIKSLIACELVRFSGGQTRTTTAAAALADLVHLMMSTLDAALFLRFFVRRPLKRWCVGPFTWTMMPFIVLFLRLVIHRRSLLELDKLSVETFGGARTLAQALVKLDSYSKTLPLDVNVAESALFLVNPLSNYEWSSWASVQPATSKRVEALTGRYPL